MHHVLLGGRIAPAALERLAEGFAEREARHNIFAGARERIAADRAAGFRPVLATAAHEFYARPIAERLGIDDVVATRATIDPAGNILSRIEGENCYGAAKHRRVAGWIAERVETRQQAYARFYSDHMTDVPSLDWADEAIVINPGAALRLIAAARGWETLTWR
jgi:HAD superfamily phosphoserine phosphatase-like hydrolase